MLNEIKKTNRDRVKYALLLISFHFSVRKMKLVFLVIVIYNFGLVLHYVSFLHYYILYWYHKKRIEYNSSSDMVALALVDRMLTMVEGHKYDVHTFVFR